MSRTEAACRAFAMHEELSPVAVDGMLLSFAGIVRDVVQQREFRIRQDLAEGSAHKMRNDLAIGERAIRGGTHGTQVVLSELRMNRGAGKFAIRNRSISLNHHAFQVVRPDLMAEAP